MSLTATSTMTGAFAAVRPPNYVIPTHPQFIASSDHLQYVRGGLWRTCMYPHEPDSDCFPENEKFVTSENGLKESWAAFRVVQALVIVGIIFSLLLMGLILFNICRNMYPTSVAAGILSIFQVAVVLDITIMMAIIFQSSKTEAMPRSWGSITYLQWLNNGLAITVTGFVLYAVTSGPKWKRCKDEKQ